MQASSPKEDIAMDGKGFRQAIAPAGLVVDTVEFAAGQILITGRSRSPVSICPNCCRPSTRVHSRYHRTLADLPSHGRPVRITLAARRFRCATVSCATRIFVERFPPQVTAAFARRTTRLDSIVHHLGLALGGRPAASLARRLLMPVSKDTLLRTVRRRFGHAQVKPTIIGIDDWAWKRGQRYGTVICDLERRCIVDLLPNRGVDTVEAWLRARPEVRIISRDRGGGYRHAAARALPGALQIADRWHLMENASQAFLDAVRKSMRAIRQALEAAEPEPGLLTCAERLQYEGFKRRQDADEMIRALLGKGSSIKAVVRATGYARKTVRHVARGGRSDVFRSRISSLDPWLTTLDAEWRAGCRNGTELWRRLKSIGFAGSRRVVAEWTTRQRRNEISPVNGSRAVPSARVIARLMTTARDQLSNSEAVLVATIEAAVPALVVVRNLADRFHRIIRQQKGGELATWIEEARQTSLCSFANGLSDDWTAVKAAIVEPWSNGQTEGQITKLKLVKRQMYGRAKLDLLRARLMPPHDQTASLHQK
jgi:transposase